MWRIAYKVPPQPRSSDNYLWHLSNRNKRGLVLDLKSPSARTVLERLVKWADVVVVNTPHPARKKLGLEYDDVVQWNPRLIYADLTGFGDKGPDSGLPGFDLTAYWARSGLLSLIRDAGAPPTMPVTGSGDHATAVGLFSAIVMGQGHGELRGADEDSGRGVRFSAVIALAGNVCGGAHHLWRGQHADRRYQRSAIA